MILSDLPPREQERYLDGITVGIGTRELGRPARDRDRLDPWHGDDEGWLWRRGFDVGFEGRDAAEDLAALSQGHRDDDAALKMGELASVGAGLRSMPVGGRSS